LTAGDWIVFSQIIFTTGGTTSSTDYFGSISLTTANVVSPVTGTLVWHQRLPATTDHSEGTEIVASQVLLSGTTSIFTNVQTTFASGTAPTASCTMWARRFR
jgi:hypothetical protein